MFTKSDIINLLPTNSVTPRNTCNSQASVGRFSLRFDRSKQFSNFNSFLLGNFVLGYFFTLCLTVLKNHISRVLGWTSLKQMVRIATSFPVASVANIFFRQAAF